MADEPERGTDAPIEDELPLDILDDDTPPSDEGTKPEEPKPEEKPAEPDVKGLIDGLSQRIEQSERATAQLIGQIVRGMRSEPRRASETPTPKEDPRKKQLTDISNGIAWAVKNKPELVPELLERRDAVRDEILVERASERAYKRNGSRNAADSLRGRLWDTYSDDLRDPQSRIAADAERHKDSVMEMLGEYMTDEQIARFRDSKDADGLAYLVSAGLNPSEVSKREVARDRAKEERRQKIRERLAGISRSGGHGRIPTKPAITDEDEELAEIYDIDLKDEKTREQILGYKETEHLQGLGGELRLAGGE